MFLSLLIALAGGGRAHRAPGRLARRGSGAPRPASWPSCCSSSPCSSPACRCACSAGASGTTSWSGMSQGISSTPAITVPYRGIDEWVRTRSCRAGRRCWRSPRCWPSGRGAARRRGYPIAAAVALGTLYAVPIIEHGPDSPYFDGAVFCIAARRLPLARARALRPARRRRDLRGGHRDRRGDRRAAPGRHPAVVQLRGVRREARAHQGRGVLVDAQLRAADVVARRARAAAHQGHRARPTGRRPTSTSSTACAGATGPPSRDAAHPAALQPPAGCRRSRSSTAGCARRSSSAPATCEDILPGASRLALPQSDGTFVTSSKPLRPGDSYQALVYVPHPTDTQLKRSSADYPGYTQDFLELHVPLRGASGRPRGPGDGQAARAPPPTSASRPTAPTAGAGIVWPSGFGVEQAGDRVMADSPYAQLYALTQQIRRDTKTPYDFVQAVMRSRAAGTTYDENPPQRPYPLASFLFDTKTRLLPAVLRRDGAHAAHGRGARARRVGLQPRQLQQRAQGLRRARHRRALVGRGLLPALRLDHLRPDARRVAGQLAARRRRRRAPTAARRCRRTSAGAWASRATARSRPATPAPASRRPSGGGGWKLPVGAAVVALAGALRRRRRCGAGARRSRTLAPERGRAAARAAPLRARPVARRDARAPGERCSAARRRPRPTCAPCATGATRARRRRRRAAQRRALRRQLGSGLGLRGALRAWWALPPLPPGALKDRRRRPYTPK